MKKFYLILVAFGFWFNGFVSGSSLVYEHFNDLGVLYLIAISVPLILSYFFMLKDLLTSKYLTNEKVSENHLVPDPNEKKHEFSESK